MKMSKRMGAFTLVITALAATAVQARDGTNSHYGNATAYSGINGGFGFNMSFNGRTRVNANNVPGPVILRGVNFRFDSAKLTPESKKNLDTVATTIKKHSGNKLVVGGHASAEGDALYNLDLSTRRARAVRNYLVKQGVTPASLTSAGYGEMHPITYNATEQGRSLNRRVELLPAPVGF